MNMESDSRVELTEQIINKFKIAMDFYRMEYSDDLRTLFNEFGYLLLCRLSNEGYLTDDMMEDGRIYAYKRKVRLKEDESSELPAKEIDFLIGFWHSTFQENVVRVNNRFSVFADFSFSIKRHSVLRQILLVIKDLILLRKQSDDMSAVYHAVYNIHSLCISSGKSASGRFFVPDRIVERLMERLYAKTESEHSKRPATVLDPQYGTGNMLMMAKKYYPNASFYGFENNQIFRISAQILAILSDMAIKTYEGEFSEKQAESQYDIVLANPVFNNNVMPQNIYLPFFSYESGEIKSQYSLFIVRILQSLAPGGHAVIITPDSFLFSMKRDYMAVREWMLDAYCLEEVIALPEKTFYPQATTRASALIVSNRAENGSRMAHGQTKAVTFYQMAQKEDDDTDGLKNRESDAEWVVDIDTIRDAGYNLLSEHYRPSSMRELEFEDPAELLMQMLKEQDEVLRDMESLLEEVENIQ
ncbi:MAG: SAM-dependent methyltransferase [Clostridium sp.]|nr:SAM-dependent methyltransferase [Clostridium sp.]